MSTITVRTNKELKEAKEKRYDEIIVEGKLAKKIRLIKRYGIPLMAVGTAAGLIAVGKFTSSLGNYNATFAGSTPLEKDRGSAGIIAVAGIIGGVFIVGILNDYDCEFEKNGKALKVRLTKKKNDI